jgi:hypothetical protein
MPCSHGCDASYHHQTGSCSHRETCVFSHLREMKTISLWERQDKDILVNFDGFGLIAAKIIYCGANFDWVRQVTAESEKQGPVLCRDPR